MLPWKHWINAPFWWNGPLSLRGGKIRAFILYCQRLAVNWHEKHRSQNMFHATTQKLTHEREKKTTKHSNAFSINGNGVWFPTFYEMHVEFEQNYKFLCAMTTSTADFYSSERNIPFSIARYRWNNSSSRNKMVKWKCHMPKFQCAVNKISHLHDSNIFISKRQIRYEDTTQQCELTHFSYKKKICWKVLKWICYQITSQQNAEKKCLRLDYIWTENL